MIAMLQLETSLRSHKTILKSCFYTPPIKVLDITEDVTDPTLHLMLMSASPGVLDGDRYTITIRLDAGSLLHLHTQSYQRLFQMKRSASQDTDVFMEAGSSFCFLPHPAVPHKASDYTAKNKIFLSSACTLLWGEVLTCGRKARGEEFQFSRYHTLTEIFLNGRLVVKENLLLQPALSDVTGLGQLEGYTHQASLICVNETLLIAEIIEHLLTWLGRQHGLCFGITTLPVNGFIVRLLGYKSEPLYACLKNMATDVQRFITASKNAATEKEAYAH